MGMQSFPSQAAVSNAASTYSLFQGAGMDGSNQQVSETQQGNRTVTQGNQCLPASGGTGGVTGGGAGPGGGPAGASGHSDGGSGGSNGAGGGVPVSGQETGRFNPNASDPANKSRRESKDNVTEEVVITYHSGTSYVTSDMTTSALHVSPDYSTKDVNSKNGIYYCEICPTHDNQGGQ